MHVSLSSRVSTWILLVYGRKQHSPGPPCWVEDLLERCVPGEPEAELTDSTKQRGPEMNEELDEVEADILEPNCDIIDPDTWASESEVDSCDAERATTLVVAPPEMEGADRNAKTKYSLRRRGEPYVAYHSRRALIKEGVM